MDNAGNWPQAVPQCAAVFGSSGGVGHALCEALAKAGCETIYAGSRSARLPAGEPFTRFAFDLEDEDSLARAADMMRAAPPQWVIVASGVLTLSDGTGPERSYKRLSADTMAQVLAVNTIGPAMIAKHMLPLMPRSHAGVFAALSARVGSISDNGLGGWHSYRASKAAVLIFHVHRKT